MKTLYIIPARYGSSRFPGKPLADIAGKSMIRRVWEQVTKIPDASVVVATDDPRIIEHVKSFHGEAIITSSQHASGTDRCAEVVQKMKETYDVIVNVQGDEPFIDPEPLLQLSGLFYNESVNIATLIKEVSPDAGYENANLVKCIINKHQEAIYFSRYPVPFRRNPAPLTTTPHYYKHIGIYAYRPEILLEITRLPLGFLEESESLEQLRWIENGFRIHTQLTSSESISVDTPDDLQRAIDFCQSNRPTDPKST